MASESASSFSCSVSSVKYTTRYAPSSRSRKISNITFLPSVICGPFGLYRLLLLQLCPELRCKPGEVKVDLLQRRATLFHVFSIALEEVVDRLNANLDRPCWFVLIEVFKR